MNRFLRILRHRLRDDTDVRRALDHSGRVEDYGQNADPLPLDRGLFGFYAMGEQVLSHFQGSTVTGFFHAGFATPERNVVARTYVDGGLTVTGTCYGRPEDLLGLALTHTGFGGSYVLHQERVLQPVSRRETVLELTYLWEMIPALQLQASLQALAGAHYSRKNTLAGALRLAASL